MTPHRVFSFPTQIEEIISIPVDQLDAEIACGDARELYEDFEQDFLYFPPPERALAARQGQSEARSRQDKIATAFAAFENLVNSVNWNIKNAEIVDFLWYRVRREMELLTTPGLGSGYSEIANSADRDRTCRFLMSQFALDYLTEASPLTRMLPGSFGQLQMAIFKIVSDEYGNGDLNQKHSVLFQNTLESIGMPRDIQFYRPYVLNSVYMYMCYVNRVAFDKRLMFRFLGFLFVYEACLIYPTQQQGRMLRHVFGERVDTTYFDAHVEIDQGHGIWVVEKMLVPLVKEYGAEAAREILRGYHETNALLLLCDHQMANSVRKRDYPIVDLLVL